MQSPFPLSDIANITGLILAGGRARRLGGQDKGLILLNNKRLIDYAVERLAAQTGTILINANRHQAQYQTCGYPVIADSLPDFAGPLAGLLSGLQHSKTDWLLAVPCDNPHLPEDLAARLVALANEKQCLLSVACCEGQLQPTYCLLHRSLHDSLQHYLARGQHKVQDWVMQQQACIVEFANCRDFANINTPQQLAEAERSHD